MPSESQPELSAGQALQTRPVFDSAGERLTLMDVWRVLIKQRLTILLVTVLFTAGSAYYVYRTKPIYESVARVEIKPNNPPNVGLQGLNEQANGENPDVALHTEVRILSSDSVLLETAESLHLIDRLRADANPKAGVSDPPSSAPLTPAERVELIGYIRGGLSVSIIPNTDLVEIHYRSTDPQLGTAIVNQLVETYSDEDLRLKYDRTMHVSTWLQQRLGELKEQAANAQVRLAEYQKEHNIVGTDENSNLTLQTLGQISGELENAEADRIMKEARLREYDSLNPNLQALMGDNPTLATLHSQLIDLETQRSELAVRLGPNHPQMKQLQIQIDKVQTQIDNEISLARAQVQAEYNGAVRVENDLRSRLGAQEDAAYKLNEGVAQYAILRHEAELNRELYDALQMRLKEASVTAGLSAADIAVVDSAQTPLTPIAPRKSMSLSLGFVGGLFCGCVLAFLIESIDDTLQTSEEVESVAMLPSLAAIPHIPYEVSGRKEISKREGAIGYLAARQTLTSLLDPKSNCAEAYRGMRSSLLLSSIDNPPRIISITSAFPGEGKTTTAVNCAIVLAQRGERVLLVDADLRRGALHHVFGISDLSFGLTTVLAQPNGHREMPVPLPELPTLHVLAAGPRPPNPAEMLSSKRMEEQLHLWTKEFDRIVLDTAPVLAVSDTQAMAVLSDSVILVARAGMTRKRALIRARDLLLRINSTIAGVVVNDVNMRLETFYTYRYGMYGYRYGHRYNSPYSDKAYGYEDEKGE
ncbi:MAG TPA: polysaccharide biosynthesis tyrosine autokinase [Terracidiphilus sp.]|nr:polysaccharide biosynthesis tyrosine autokinase [Terracidiphilus sp.]